MIRVVNESAGDITLNKFILVQMDKLDNHPENYEDVLNGYYYQWSYTYNKLTNQTDDRLKDHASVIDSLPREIRYEFRNGERHAWGKTDWYKDRVRFYISDNYLSKKQLDWIKNKCNVKGD